jgi:aspartyl-tRNA(Asn)/glutamyl-tRNA(Gln) amidotransferase subunit A
MTQPLGFATVRQLSGLIRSGEVSPLELARFFLDRLEGIGPRYNAVVTLTKELAIEQATTLDQEAKRGKYRSILHGIPYGAKDLLATARGIPTTWGASPLRNQLFDYDATVIQKLETNGATLAAKLAMVELAGGFGYRNPNASFTGPGITPWGEIPSWSGGSSSGSASSVAAGLVPFAIGSETWGSILTPANNCGISGLRPTFGRVSRHGAMTLSWSLDKIGPLCHTADDCGLLLEAISGHDPLDPSTTKRTFRYQDYRNDHRFKIGVIRDISSGCEDEVKTNFEEALSSLMAVADIEEITIPDLPYEAATRTILFAELGSAFEDFINNGSSRELTAPEDKFGGFVPSMVLAKDYIKALRIRDIITQEADRLLSRYDALTAPTRPTVATKAEGEFTSMIRGKASDVMGAMGNISGLPAISVPNGFGKYGLPTGIQFMGRCYNENAILGIAHAYQSITNWHKMYPPRPDHTSESLLS